MAVSSYAELGSAHSTTAATLTWAAQESALARKPILEVLDRDSMIDYSVPGSRLREGPGYIEIIPKTPGEVIGERVLRPMLDATYDWSLYTLEVLKGGFRFFDAAFSRAINFLPGVGAQPHRQEDRDAVVPRPEECIAVSKIFNDVVPGIVDKPNAVELLEAVKNLADPLMSACRQGDDYQKTGAQYKDAQDDYESENQNAKTALQLCEDKCQDGEFCYLQKISSPPARFQREQWMVTEGYMSWKVFIVCEGRLWTTETMHARGSYNYDDVSGKPTVETKQSILKQKNFR